MKTKNIIFGGVGLLIVGGIAYFYLKSKNKGSLTDTLGGGLANTGSSSTGSSSTGSSSTGSSNTGSSSTGGSSTTPKQISPNSLTDEQAITYANKYPEIKKVFGLNADKLKEHWIKFGKAEGKTIPDSDKVLDSAPINTPASQEETAKQIQAQGLATQITILKSQFDTLIKTDSRYERCGFESKPTIGNDKGSMENLRNCEKNLTMITDKRIQITKLGYKEVNGIAVKL
jgi:hypothetical protein